MSTPYQPGIPTGTVKLNTDYQNIQTNFTQLNSIFGIDHTQFSTAANSGYHTVVHLVKQNSNPAPVGLVGEIYCKQITSINTDEALFYQSGGGRVIQMTMNQVPSAAANGYSFMPGGILVQWGVVNGTHASLFIPGDTGTVTFATANIAFPNNCFGVVINPSFSTGTVPGTTAVSAFSYNNSTLSKTKFDWKMTGSSAAYSQFFWVAIGN